MWPVLSSSTPSSSVAGVSSSFVFIDSNSFSKDLKKKEKELQSREADLRKREEIVKRKEEAAARGPSWCGFCHSEGIGCSTSYGVTNNWMRSPDFPKTCDNLESRYANKHKHKILTASYMGYVHISRFRCKNPFLGDTRFNWWHTGRKSCMPTVSVAVDYPDSVPESSNYVAKNGYHPLEDIKTSKRVRETKLTGAEIAKTAVEEVIVVKEVKSAY